MKRFRHKLAAAAIAALGVMSSANLQAVPVDLELAMMVDVSGSVDAADFALQRTGIANAFSSPALVTAIQAGAIGSIAATLVYWSSNGQQQQAVGWMEINDAATANAFSAAVAAAARPFSGGTGMAAALTFTAPLFLNNGLEGTREVIDVSGDGAESEACGFGQLNCVPLQNARDAFLGGGASRTINALWIDDRDFFGDDPADQINALQYGALNVIGGVNPFQLIVQDFSGFQGAIANKLVREVTGVPEPGTLALLGAVLLGLFGIRRKLG
jgi:hypothetical protein